MRVKCTKPETDKVTNTAKEGWLTVGREYDVLAVYFDRTQGTLFRIIGNDTFTPALFPLEILEITDSRIPQNWVLEKDSSGVLRLSPKAWLETGYWDRFFDREPQAIKIFEEEVARAKR